MDIGIEKHKCKKCGVLKSKNEFKKAREKLSSSCKACDSIYRREHYLRNREHTLEVNRLWSLNNPDHAKNRSAEWYKNNKERHNALTAASYQKNKDFRKQKNREWYAANKLERAKTINAWKLRNPDKIKIIQAAYYKRNPDHFKRVNAYRGIAEPLWLNTDQKREIAEFYQISKLLTQVTGVRHHVDHVVPLRGKRVCGLHVPWNLQILTARDNQKKSNTFACE